MSIQLTPPAHPLHATTKKGREKKQKGKDRKRKMMLKTPAHSSTMPEHSIFKFFLFLLTTVQALFVHPQTPFSLPTNDRGPVPGSSPVRYYADPTTFLYKIDKLDMYPNPCVMQVQLRLFPTTTTTNTHPCQRILLRRQTMGCISHEHYERASLNEHNDALQQR